MNYLALALILLVLVSGCTTLMNESNDLSDSVTADEALNDLDSVLVDESEDVELGSLI